MPPPLLSSAPASKSRCPFSFLPPTAPRKLAKGIDNDPVFSADAQQTCVGWSHPPVATSPRSKDSTSSIEKHFVLPPVLYPAYTTFPLSPSPPRLARSSAFYTIVLVQLSRESSSTPRNPSLSFNTMLLSFPCKGLPRRAAPVPRSPRQAQTKSRGSRVPAFVSHYVLPFRVLQTFIAFSVADLDPSVPLLHHVPATNF